MEIDDLWGLPAHPLLVHAVVVLVPLTAAGAVVAAVLPAARRRVGWLVAVGAAVTAALVPLVTGSGEALEERVAETALVERHAEMGSQLLPWVVGLAVTSVLLMVGHSLAERGSHGGGRRPRGAARWVVVALVVPTVFAGLGATVQVARIGHSGAEATWSDTPVGESGSEEASSLRR